MDSTILGCFIFMLFSLSIAQVNSEICYGISQNDQCSTNSACSCFRMVGAVDAGLCVFSWVECSELTTCNNSNNVCSEPEHICLHHPRCQNQAVCYPVSMMNRRICPPMIMTNTTTTVGTTTMTHITTHQPVIPEIPVDAQWEQNGITVAGGNGQGSDTNQLHFPVGIFVDDDQTIVIADVFNHRIVQWKVDDKSGQVVAGGNGQGNRLDQLNYPNAALIDKETNSLIICEDQRVVKWSRLSGTKEGEILIDNIRCSGLAIDDQRYLYVAISGKHEVLRYQMGDNNGTLVAGGNGWGNNLNQFYMPVRISVDQQQSIYVSDNYNERVIKWNKGATQGIVVAGGQGRGNASVQLHSPYGLFADTLSTLYVADYGNDRVMRWPKGAKEGTVIVGGNGRGSDANQFSVPTDLFFDRYGNLYVADRFNHRVQRFSIK